MLSYENIMKVKIETKKQKRANRVRSKISGNGQVPRLSVFRSAKYIYVQAIDDQNGHTLLASEKIAKEKDMTKVDVAKKTGELFGAKLKKVGIKKAVFDRGSFKYHGRVRALAEGIRSAGIKF